MTPEHAARPSFKEIQKLGEDWEPDFDSLYNFPPASKLSMIARLVIRDGRVRDAGFVPVFIDRDAVPRAIAQEDRRYSEVVDYLRAVTAEAGLNGAFAIDGSHVSITNAGCAS
jgi:poly-gamma-glutamate synthesis protein (capsule biosynthesis protein)